MVSGAKQVGGAQQVCAKLARSILILDPLRGCFERVVGQLALLRRDPTYRYIRCGRLRMLTAVRPPTESWGARQEGVP